MSVFSIRVMTHMHELLGALLTVFTHILLWVLISCLTLIKAVLWSVIIRCTLRKPIQCLQTAGRG